MRVDLFDFELPPGLIAQRPAVPRDSARLLEVGAAGLLDRRISDLPQLLRAGDLLVLNDTRVLPARLRGHRLARDKRPEIAIEMLLLRRHDDGAWTTLARPGKRLRPDDRLRFGEALSATIAARADDGTLRIRFDSEGPAFAERLSEVGAMPLPPYIRGGVADARDRADYQTMFARNDGAVAAPTAALHFTPELMDALQAQGIGTVTVTLHVGSGTFQPVRSEDTDQHQMAMEWGRIGEDAAAAIAACRRAGGRIVAVGTTALRLIESAARRNGGTVAAWSGDTDLFIVPGFRFRTVDLLLTNFHLPRSTLFMLVAAFAGLERMHAAYAHAINSGYRFYSYGDACLLHRGDRS